VALVSIDYWRAVDFIIARVFGDLGLDFSYVKEMVLGTWIERKLHR